jgi:hypothetical protein
MRRIETRLQRLESAKAGVQMVTVVIRRFHCPSDDGPQETGQAIASFTRGPVPNLHKSFGETFAEFDDRIDQIDTRLSAIRHIPEGQRASELDLLAREITAANAYLRRR